MPLIEVRRLTVKGKNLSEYGLKMPNCNLCRTTMAQTQRVLLKAERHFRFCERRGILATPVVPFAPFRGDDHEEMTSHGRSPAE